VRRSRRLLPLVLLGVLGLRAAGDEPWTPEDAEAALGAVLAPPDAALRREAAADWLARVEDEGVDLGDRGWIRAAALRVLGEERAAGDLLLARLATGVPLEAGRLRGEASGILLARTVVAVGDEDVATGRRALDGALDLAERRDRVYLEAGRACVADGRPAALVLLVRLTRRLLGDDALDAEAKVTLLARIHGVGGREEPARYERLDLTTIDGKRIRREDLLDKIVLVDYWGTWCVPCRMAVPHLQRLYERYASRGLVVLGLAYERGPEEAHLGQVRDFVRTEKVTYPMALGTPELEAAVPDFGGWPTLVFLRPGLVYDHRTTGFSPSHVEEIEAWVREAIEERARRR
jgi:thiol-disulfide isomerase/thioredoxin